jgi:hypothetical protein
MVLTQAVEVTTSSMILIVMTDRVLFRTSMGLEAVINSGFA